ncbi:uncharacterized protein LOC119682554 [Teleopsis dalmanni]|uniref:uncharacterized protein LOC119682554 n=1 Tax=Teleopsis dalmanni TaxID=139649 RepID=UPI0018CECB7D|nr:uncharacterized protein LOC119682554 [Teleopsis dalmanni]
MDCDFLISLVEEQPPLWNQKHKLYNNRNVVKKIWADIARNMNETDDKVRQKWRGLRDTYRKELSKCAQKRSGGATRQHSSKWRYFSRLSFLREQFESRPSTRNILALQSDTNESEVEFISLDTTEKIVEDMSDGNSGSEYNSTPNPRKIKTPIQDEAIHEAHMMRKKQKMKYLKNKSEQQNNDDYHFAMSIVPFLRNVPTHKKLGLRSRIQQLIEEELCVPEAHLIHAPVYN